MTKKDMISKIQEMEAEAWLDLAKYEYENMPECTMDEEMKWEIENVGYN